jgi:hypothetical protein
LRTRHVGKRQESCGGSDPVCWQGQDQVCGRRAPGEAGSPALNRCTIKAFPHLACPW